MIDYHEIGKIGDLVISHTAMCQLDPDMGGHPSKFMAFFQETKDRPYTPSMEKGDLLHLWQEHEDKFAIDELDKPAPQMAKFAEVFNDLYNLEGYKIRSGITENLTLDFNDVFAINEIYSGFWGKKAEQVEFDLLAACIFLARREAEVNKALTNNKLLDKFSTECIPYIRFLRSANGKIILDRKTKDVLTNCQASIKAHPTVQKLYELPCLKEQEYYWTEIFSNPTKEGGDSLKRKIKIDRIIIDELNKKLIIIDLKTTSTPASKFQATDGPFYKYKLGRQLVNYADGFFKANKIDERGWTIELYNIVVQTTDTYPTIVYKLSFARTHECKVDLNKIVNRVVFHIKTNQWDLTKEEYEQGYIEIG